MDRRALIAAATKAVRKQFKGSITDIASRALEFPSVWASTGSLSLDRLCAGFNPGGIPMGPRYGRIIHIAGEWSTAKSLILDHLFKSVLVDLGGLAKCTETEGSRDPHFANAIGLPLDLLVIDRPDSFEHAFDMFESWHEAIRKEDEEIPVIWGFDSLDSTEAEKSTGKALSESGGWHFGGGRAEVLGAGLRRMAKLCSRYPTTIVLLNQTRDNVGAMFGPKKRTPGGNPPHFYASLELMLKASPRPGGGYVRSDVAMPEFTKAAIKRLGLYNLEDTAVIGRYIRATCTKTKMSTTLDTTADFYVDFRRGIHAWEGLAERLIAEGLLRTNPDASGDFEMPGVTMRDQPDKDKAEFVDAPAKFKTKREWLNFVAKNMEVLRARVPEAKP
jgi:RecA/RadA recombinase